MFDVIAPPGTTTSGGTDATSGAGAPSSTPAALGALYYDTTNKDWYIAIGTSSAADWKFTLGEIFEAEESTGGVTQLALTGFPALQDGAEYEISGTVIQTGSGTPVFGLLCNNETSDTNYSYRASLTVAGDSNQTTRGTNNLGYANSDGDVCSFYYRVRVTGNKITAKGTVSSSVTTNVMAYAWAYDDGSAPPTRFDVYSSVASKIAAGTKLTLRRTA